MMTFLLQTCRTSNRKFDLNVNYNLYNRFTASTFHPNHFSSSLSLQVWALHEKSLNRVPVEKKQQRKLNQQMMKQQQLNDEVEGKRELGAENGISL